MRAAKEGERYLTSTLRPVGRGHAVCVGQRTLERSTNVIMSSFALGQPENPPGHPKKAGFVTRPLLF